MGSDSGIYKVVLVFHLMAAIVGFLVIHVSLAVLVPKSLRAMITGR